MLDGLAGLPFPNGVTRYAVGGLLVGLGTLVIYAGTGVAAGASTFLESTLSYVSDASPWRLFVGGVLVGVGTRVGKGCTSGHGICGVGSVSRTSLVGVATFVLVAIVTANVVAALGVTP